VPVPVPVPEQEGVTKFDLRFTPAPPLLSAELCELNAWRKLLWQLKLIGQDASRYHGLGFGNLSRRQLPSQHFIISGTQTGHLPELDGRHYATVTEADTRANRVLAEGPMAPSSEALTHAMLYQVDTSVQFIFHVHSPALWHGAADLGIPVTNPTVAYGTPAMAEEVRRLSADAAAWRTGIFAMGGHEDGIVAFGKTAEETGIILLQYLARALTAHH